MWSLAVSAFADDLYTSGAPQAVYTRYVTLLAPESLYRWCRLPIVARSVAPMRLPYGIIFPYQSFCKNPNWRAVGGVPRGTLASTVVWVVRLMFAVLVASWWTVGGLLGIPVEIASRKAVVSLRNWSSVMAPSSLG